MESEKLENKGKNKKEENNKAEEKKEEVKSSVAETKTEQSKSTDNPVVTIDNENLEKIEEKNEIKKEEKKEVKKAEIHKKEEAIAKGTNLHASKKHCMYICSFIKNKPIDIAITQLNEVISHKRAIPFKGEIPHRHELGGRPGRYPINASKQFIDLLKALKGNVIANGLDIDKTKIYLASATWASRPAKKGGMRFKRAFVLLKAKEFDMKEENKKKKEKKEIKEEKK